MASKKTATAKSAAATPAATSGTSALDMLMSLIETKPAAATPAQLSSNLEASLSDPAMIGAKRNKNTATLGFDPEFAPKVKHGAALAEAMKTAEALFKGVQAELREYGKNKRGLFNNIYKCNVTTVAVPFTVEVPVTEDSATPGHETKYLQVICTNKYSVSQDTVLALKEQLGDNYGKLFSEETTTTLKPNAEELFKNILAQLGLDEAKVEKSMEVLFDKNTTVSTQEDYEQEHAKLDEQTQHILNQSVTRQQPGLKFV